MRYRKLRIAWSVGWGIACVISIATAYLLQQSNPIPPPAVSGADAHWHFKLSRSHTQITGVQPDVDLRKIRTIDFLGFNRQGTWNHLLVAIPHWLPVAFCMAVGYWTPDALRSARAIIARLNWRFSLRTLLIATTLVAVVLGLIVWAVRSY